MSRELRVGVKALLQNKDGKFLLLKRSERGAQHLIGQWDMPGGRIEDDGTSLFENLQRELMEETKLELVDEPKLIEAQDIIDENRHTVRLTYVGVIDGQVVLNEEHTEYGWFTKEEMEALGDSLDYFARQILHLV